MPYKIVFRNGENAKNGEEVVVNASYTRFDTKSGFMEFLDNSNMVIAFIPIEKVLYIKKAD